MINQDKKSDTTTHNEEERILNADWQSLQPMKCGLAHNL